MSTAVCPISPTRDDRKSAALADAEARPDQGFAPIQTYDFARDIMRSPAVRQGMEAEYFKDKEPSKADRLSWQQSARALRAACPAPASRDW